MKIAIDCADLDHSRIDGTRVYIKNILNFLGKLDPQSQFLLYHKKDFNPALKPNFFANYIERKIPYSFFWTQTRFGFELRKDLPAVCWMPIQQIPLIGPSRTKYVVTIHDLAFKIFPDHFPFLDQIKLNLFTSSAVLRSDGIIAVSHSTKNDIEHFFPQVNKEKIAVIYHGVDKNFFVDSKKEEIARVKEKFGLKKYLLYVGAIQPRKGLVVLVEAFERLKKKGAFKDLQLALVGEAAWKAEPTLKRIEKSSFRQDILLLGKIGFGDLPMIYQGAELFVFPSLYEGFGMPLLEAFAAGCPVVAADNSSLVEIGQKAALFFKTGDVFSLELKLQRVLKSQDEKNRMKNQGRKQAKEFSWEKSAQETLDFLKKIACQDSKQEN